MKQGFLAICLAAVLVSPCAGHELRAVAVGCYSLDDMARLDRLTGVGADDFAVELRRMVDRGACVTLKRRQAVAIEDTVGAFACARPVNLTACVWTWRGEIE